jgi:hypothetical protein
MLKIFAVVLVQTLVCVPGAAVLAAGEDSAPRKHWTWPRRPAPAIAPAPDESAAPTLDGEAHPAMKLRTLRAPAPKAPTGDGSRPDDTIGGLPGHEKGAEQTAPDKPL